MGTSISSGILLEAIMQPAASSRNRGRITERERASPRVILTIIIIISEQKTSFPVLLTMNCLEKERERERASPRVILIIIIIIISEQKTSSPVLSTMNRLEKERERE
jgi:hypothetical protein